MSEQIIIIKRYEDLSNNIDILLEKRRGWWKLEKGDITFDDIKQEIRLHIFQKWEQWKQELPFENWCNRLITNQLKNKLRNNFGNYVRPCIGNPPCRFNEGGTLCSFTASHTQCSECPLYAKWEKSKKDALAIHLPESLEKHGYEVGAIDNNIEPQEFLSRIAPKIKQKCLPQTYKVFKLVFIQKLSEKEAALRMGYKDTKKGMAAGLKQISNHTDLLKEVVKTLLSEEDARFI